MSNNEVVLIGVPGEPMGRGDMRSSGEGAKQYDERGNDIPAPDPQPEVLSPQTPGLIHMEPDDEIESDPPSGRRAARAAAVQALYEAESTGHPALAALDRVAERDALSAELREFAALLVSAVESDRLSLDERIGILAPARPVNRIDRVDRTILRLALAELLFEGDSASPPAVIANEAVELGRLYGSESSPRFINGVLGTVLR